jgi:diguanylate cyclase (GGDEF)-like protein
MTSESDMSRRTIVLISKDAVLTNIVATKLEHSYGLIPFTSITSALDCIYNSIPDLVVFEFDPKDRALIDVFNNLKTDPIFSQLPVLAILPEEAGIPDWRSFFVEDYISIPDLEREVLARVDLCIVRSERIVEINPLTRLPGNISINKQIQTRIEAGEPFALAYLDIDQFKPFNDKYGFSRGDEVIKVTGRLILNIVKNRQPQRSFVGHIGGDDFIYIMDEGLIEETSAEIIDAFDRLISTFYDGEDRERGRIQSKDRQGNTETFPLMSVSVGAAANREGQFSHYGEITEIASRMKTYSKRFKGSSFSMDKRRPHDDVRPIDQ